MPYRRRKMTGKKELCFLLPVFCFLFPVICTAATEKVYVSSGTGFFVSRDGYVITNLHVVSYCQRLTVAGAVSEREAAIVARDQDNDLALLKVSAMGIDAGELRTKPLAAGDRLVIHGYPGKAGVTETAVTREAEVVSPKGPRGEEKWVQLSDVLEQGNSGGPLLDGAGNVAGVVAAKAVIYSYKKSDPQNGTTRKASVAVATPVVQKFLDSARVNWRESDDDSDLSTHRVVDKARRFVVHVKCQYKTEVR